MLNIEEEKLLKKELRQIRAEIKDWRRRKLAAPALVSPKPAYKWYADKDDHDMFERLS